LEHLADETELDRAIDSIRTGQTNPYRISDQLYRQFLSRP